MICASRSGIPISPVMTVAIFSALAFNPSAMRCRQAARSSGGVCDQTGNAALAALTARSTSSLVPRGTLPMTSSVVALMTLTRSAAGRGDPFTADVEFVAIVPG